MFRVLVACVLLSGVSSAFAKSFDNDVHANKSSLNEASVNERVTNEKASFWGVTLEEYQHYEYLMENTPAGKWWPHMDPTEVLGMMAESEQDQLRYAAIVAKQMDKRTDVAIRFGHQTQAAHKRIFPDKKPIMFAEDYAAANMAKGVMAGDEFLAFVAMDIEGSSVVRRLLDLVKTANIKVNIYVVGNVNSDAINDWAAGVPIPYELVNTRKVVTISKDDGRMSEMLGLSATIPSLVRSRYGAMEKVSVSAL